MICIIVIDMTVLVQIVIILVGKNIIVCMFNGGSGMHNCNCVVNYQAQKEEYVTTVNMIKNGFNSLDMLWDTGAGNTVIYLNLLRKVKGINEYDLSKLEALLNFNNKNKIGYRFKLFGSALTEKSIGILCCANSVYVNHLHLDIFIFLYYLLIKIKLVVF